MADKLYTQAQLDAAIQEALRSEAAARADAERRADAAELSAGVARADLVIAQIQNDAERERAEFARNLAYVSLLVVHRPRFMLTRGPCSFFQAQWTC